eukprot:TRINITY_DN44255_c0_g1_i1.p1 TRINITY_DN44255_c0_g1~~TRINITY_DN44255_c0_g1_i1.p1  ORF type:complete len:226 (-),score=15.38 TRINITY_DN44255_c0_g1_i1:37-636(-)
MRADPNFLKLSKTNFRFNSEVDHEAPIEEAIACTEDAQVCPDGSYVGRIPPSCQFEKCPQHHENHPILGFLMLFGCFACVCATCIACGKCLRRNCRRSGCCKKTKTELPTIQKEEKEASVLSSSETQIPPNQIPLHSVIYPQMYPQMYPQYTSSFQPYNLPMQQNQFSYGIPTPVYYVPQPPVEQQQSQIPSYARNNNN